MKQDFLEMKGISKSFGHASVLQSVDFSARKGEVHALMGENGAGKSTLMKILSGVYSSDAGEIFIEGKKVNIPNPKTAKELGISIIYQEFALADDLSVAENIYIDRLDSVIHWNQLYDRAKNLLDKLGFSDIDPRSTVSDISIAYQQVVEICKALSRNSRILVFDEPTAVLTSNEVKQFFDLIRQLREEGVCIIYISHRLEEIFELCDRITVLKDGDMIKTVNTNEITENELVRLMIGRELSEMYPAKTAKIGDIIFKAENIQVPGIVDNVSFYVRSGEILGVSGLVGSGRTETMQAIFGALPRTAGKVTIMGKEQAHHPTPERSVRQGLGMLPEDRKADGLLLDLEISANATLSSLGDYVSRLKFIDFKKEAAAVNEKAGLLRLKMTDISQTAGDLSGGNQQKVALMKWILANSKVLILDEPTRGVDVGAKTEIYKIMDMLAAQGIGIIMISSEMPEVIGMSDRVIIMHEGKIAGELNRDELTEMNLITLSMGLDKGEENE